MTKTRPQGAPLTETDLITSAPRLPASIVPPARSRDCAMNAAISGRSRSLAPPGSGRTIIRSSSRPPLALVKKA